MDPVLSLAVRFIEQGGIWVLVGFIVLLLGISVWAVRRLFDAYERVQEARVTENRTTAEKAIAAVEAARVSTEATTRAVELNAQVSEAHRLTLSAIKDSVDALSRALSDRSRR